VQFQGMIAEYERAQIADDAGAGNGIWRNAEASMYSPERRTAIAM
jgi:hypothetical protein